MIKEAVDADMLRLANEYLYDARDAYHDLAVDAEKFTRDDILIRVEPYMSGKYRMVWLRGGIEYTDIIDANSHTEAAKAAAKKVGCDESIVMLPVTQEEVNVILSGCE